MKLTRLSAAPLRAEGAASCATGRTGRTALALSSPVFKDKNGAQIFVIPMKSITNVTNVSETDSGSFGRKMALGIFASKTEEFLTVTSESPDGAEAIVFKCKKKTSPGMVAKIQFYMKANKPS